MRFRDKFGNASWAYNITSMDTEEERLLEYDCPRQLHAVIHLLCHGFNYLVMAEAAGDLYAVRCVFQGINDGVSRDLPSLSYRGVFLYNICRKAYIHAMLIHQDKALYLGSRTERIMVVP